MQHIDLKQHSHEHIDTLVRIEHTRLLTGQKWNTLLYFAAIHST